MLLPNIAILSSSGRQEANVQAVQTRLEQADRMTAAFDPDFVRFLTITMASGRYWFVFSDGKPATIVTLVPTGSYLNSIWSLIASCCDVPWLGC
jgi:hypothetical protein